VVDTAEAGGTVSDPVIEDSTLPWCKIVSVVYALDIGCEITNFRYYRRGSQNRRSSARQVCRYVRKQQFWTLLVDKSPLKHYLGVGFQT
jgi:hypothetical protein